MPQLGAVTVGRRRTRRRWQNDCKGAATTGIVFDLNSAAMSVHGLAYDGEAQSEAASVGAALDERLEELHWIPRGKTAAMVVHLNSNELIVTLSLHVNGAPGPGELDGVTNKVANRRAKQTTIPGEWQSRLYVDDNGNIPAFGCGQCVFDRLLDHEAEVEGFTLWFDITRQPIGRQNFVHELAKAAEVAIQNRMEPLVRRGKAKRGRGRASGHERVPQLVSDECDMPSSLTLLLLIATTDIARDGLGNSGIDGFDSQAPLSHGERLAGCFHLVKQDLGEDAILADYLFYIEADAQALSSMSHGRWTLFGKRGSDLMAVSSPKRRAELIKDMRKVVPELSMAQSRGSLLPLDPGNPAIQDLSASRK